MSEHVECAKVGLLDALKAFPYSTLLLYRSGTLRKLAFKCFLLNGLLFLGSIAAWEFVLRPLIHMLFRLLSASQTSATSSSSRVIISVTDSLASSLYYGLWVWPVYGLSFLLNSIWYQDIATQAFRIHSSSSSSSSKKPLPYRGFVSVVADEVFRTFMFSIYVLEAMLVYFVPFVGPLVSFVLICWLYAYYSFEYNWMSKGWSLERRLIYFESHWAYFAGFGLPCTLFTFWFPQLVGGGLFALLFPSVCSIRNCEVLLFSDIDL
eukprot:Partr_v1_DN25940_c1_g1_i1_m68594 putative Etoposide induced 2.4 mRNA